MFLYKVILRPLQFASRGECTTVLGVLLATFFWDTLYIWPPLYRALCLLGGRLPTWPTSPLPPSASVALGNRQGGAASMSVRIQIPPPLTSSTSLQLHVSCDGRNRDFSGYHFYILALFDLILMSIQLRPVCGQLKTMISRTIKFGLRKILRSTAYKLELNNFDSYYRQTWT